MWDNQIRTKSFELSWYKTKLERGSDCFLTINRSKLFVFFVDCLLINQPNGLCMETYMWPPDGREKPLMCVFSSSLELFLMTNNQMLSLLLIRRPVVVFESTFSFSWIVPAWCLQQICLPPQLLISSLINTESDKQKDGSSERKEREGRETEVKKVLKSLNEKHFTLK